jgi:hypothetical protein
MKINSSLVRLAFAACLALSFGSCKLFDKADDITFDVTFEHTFNINQTAEDTDVIYQPAPQLLDAAAVSTDFDRYKDKIKAVSVHGVTYEFKNVATSGVLFTDGKIAYSAATATTPDPDVNIGTTALVGVENIKAAEDQEKNLQYGQVALNDMSNLLTTGKELNVYLSGTLSKTPAKFDVVLRVKATVTASAL